MAKKKLFMKEIRLKCNMHMHWCEELTLHSSEHRVINMLTTFLTVPLPGEGLKFDIFIVYFFFSFCLVLVVFLCLLHRFFFLLIRNYMFIDSFFFVHKYHPWIKNNSSSHTQFFNPKNQSQWDTKIWKFIFKKKSFDR